MKGQIIQITAEMLKEVELREESKKCGNCHKEEWPMVCSWRDCPKPNREELRIRYKDRLK